jgi:predicted O-methyltransferase YrrM
MRDFNIDTLKYMAGRFNPIPTGNDFLDARYIWQMTDNGQEWPYYRFFYHLSRKLQPRVVVELGGYQGTAAAHFAAGWPGSTVITIDHHTDPGDEENQQKMKEVCFHYPTIVYMQGWTNTKTAARERGKHGLGDAGSAYQDIIKQTLYFGRKIDILFVDSWHTYENVQLDWHAYKPLLSNPSLVIFDDIQEGEDKNSPISGMMRFWNKLPEPKFLNDNLHPGTQMGFLKYEIN